MNKLRALQIAGITNKQKRHNVMQRPEQYWRCKDCGHLFWKYKGPSALYNPAPENKSCLNCKGTNYEGIE